MLSGTCRVHQESQKRRARYCCLHSMATAVLVTFAAFAPTQTGANNSASAGKPTLVASESDHAESDLAIDVNVDYGAQLLLTDSQGGREVTSGKPDKSSVLSQMLCIWTTRFRLRLMILLIPPLRNRASLRFGRKPLKRTR
jgi:hypothetical protein